MSLNPYTRTCLSLCLTCKNLSVYRSVRTVIQLYWMDEARIHHSGIGLRRGHHEQPHTWLHGPSVKGLGFLEMRAQGTLTLHQSKPESPQKIKKLLLSKQIVLGESMLVGGKASICGPLRLPHFTAQWAPCMSEQAD